MIAYLYIALGSALGGMARFWCQNQAAALWGETFPYGTVLLNILGSGLIGAFAGANLDAQLAARTFLMVGFCGGYTTFSSFSLQTLLLLHDGNYASAALNCAGSLALCLLAVWAGYALGGIFKA